MLLLVLLTPHQPLSTVPAEGSCSMKSSRARAVFLSCTPQPGREEVSSEPRQGWAMHATAA